MRKKHTYDGWSAPLPRPRGGRYPGGFPALLFGRRDPCRQTEAGFADMSDEQILARARARQLCGHRVA